MWSSFVYCIVNLWSVTYCQCCGSGESVSFPCIRIRIKNWLDPESISNYTDPTKTIEHKKNFNFLPWFKWIFIEKWLLKIYINKTWDMSVLSHFKDFLGTHSFLPGSRLVTKLVLSWIRNEFFHILDPYQNFTDPPHWLLLFIRFNGNLL